MDDHPSARAVSMMPPVEPKLPHYAVKAFDSVAESVKVKECRQLTKPRR